MAKADLEKIIEEKGTEGFINNFNDIMKGNFSSLRNGFDVNS